MPAPGRPVRTTDGVSSFAAPALMTFASVVPGLLLTLVVPPTPDPARTPRQEVEWFHSGWYVGASAGTMNADASASELDRDLARRGWTTDSSLDDTDFAWKVFAGYRFEAPFAIEVGYTDLGQIDSKIEAMPADLDAFLDDVADVHPFSANGVTLSAQWFPLDTRHVDFGLRGGLWYWDAEVDVDGPGGASVDVDEDGIDPLAGVGVWVRVTERIEVRAEFEKYWVDGDDIDFFSAGLQIQVL